MPQAQALVTTLKKSLKAHSLTYRDVAAGLDLSEASVKRLFAEQHFSLERLEQICRLMDMEIGDLVKCMEADQQHIHELSEAQEHELATDTRLLLVAFLAVNGWTFDEILQRHVINETELIRDLAKLDRIKLIELLPKNRIKLLIAPNFSWRRNGPIQRFFTANLQDDFLKSSFEDRAATFQFLSGMLTAGSIEQLRKKSQLLAQEFHSLNLQDRTAPLEQREPYTVMLACRPWKPSVFQPIRK
ncbi:MAG: helix-turn-helix transcriptional regulator [Gammaproteobacteria bacterium]|nr:helix-turn-helix transcriptional regulator [Gammaproteobacteria bacterium]